MPIRHPSVRVAFALNLAGLALLCASTASANEVIYGATPATDSGARGVNLVRFCGGVPGFISVGTRTVGNQSDVYVVRTSLAGAVVFERFYNINGQGAKDSGSSIVELSNGSGFVVAGTSNVNGNIDDALLLRIDCNGNAIFSFTYGGPLRESATDIIEAQTGNAAAGTAPGDLVISGTATNPVGGNTDALLFRVRNNGNLIWNRRFDINAVNESFAALTEARPSLAGPTGDIVAVGAWRNGVAPDQGYVVRVSGDTGNVGGGNTCSAIYGGPDTDRFTGVFESRVGATAGQLYFTGTSTSAAQANDIYLVRAQPNPCAFITQRRIGALATSAFGDESPADIEQQSAALGIGPLGGILLTGGVGTSTTTAYDAFLLSADINTLVPFAGRRYGQAFGRRDQGASLSQLPAGLPAGVVIAGTSLSDFQALGDPSDMYLVRTDGNGNTNCSANWMPPHVTVNFPASQVPPTAASFLVRNQWPVAVQAQNTAFQSCP
jgi:hypothetical protein